VIFSGHDESSKQSVRGRRIYSAVDILIDYSYVDIVRMDETGAPTFDYTKFHDVKPAAPRAPNPAAFDFPAALI